MNKRKILTLAMTLAMVAILAIGGTLAYFTDTDTKTNTFTVGNVDITLNEQFDNNSKLVPGTKDQNNVAKVVTVTNNNGSESAYVRVQIAVPSGLVDQNLMSYNDILHWNFNAADYQNAKWSMQPNYTTGNGWTDNGRTNQNVYNTKIGNEDYTVWVVTYRTALAAGATTDGAAMTQVYIDNGVNASKDATTGKVTYSKVDKVNGGTMSYTIDSDIKIYVVAEGCQSEGFTNAYEALNASFGVPGTYTPSWT